ETARAAGADWRRPTSGPERREAPPAAGPAGGGRCGCSTGGTNPSPARAWHCSGDSYPWTCLCKGIGRCAPEIERAVGSAEAAEAVERNHGGGQGGRLGPEDAPAERNKPGARITRGRHLAVREPALGADDQTEGAGAVDDHV